MSLRDLTTGAIPIASYLERSGSGPPARADCRQRAMSRRQFGRTVAAATLTGAALGAGLHRPGWAMAHGSHEPKPIPGGTPLLGGAFHVFGPGIIDPIDAEPSSITDFNGFVGIAFISGTVTRTNVKIGEVRTLPFVDSDMRFMKGVYRGMDGQVHQGGFAFI